MIWKHHQGSMKKLLTLILGLYCSGQLLAQSYSYTQSTGTSEPYLVTTTGTSVLGISSVDVLSSSRTLPFAWNFFGQPVTTYKVSDNGYITFDGAATTSFATNTAIPDAGGPNNAIYAFWDDMNVVSGSGTADNVVTFNYGTAPNRVHVIQWYSVTPASGTGFVYAAIRIYECGDFDVVLNYGNTSGMTATIGCENATGTVGAQTATSPNAPYPNPGADASDDIVYTFFYQGINYDAAVTSLNFSGGSVSLGNNTVAGTLRNNGSTAITSMRLNYTVNGGTPVSTNLTGINIAPNGGTYNFSHPTQWNVPSGGVSYDLCVYADQLNGSNADQRTCNDSYCDALFSRNGTSTTKTVVIEEFSGAWCGWCPDGTVVLDQIVNSNPNKVFPVTVHDGDAMEFSDGIRTGFNVTAYPNGQVDRYLFSGQTKVPHSRGAWTNNTTNRLNAFTPVDVSVASNYNSTTRAVEATVTASFVDYEAGDLRIVLEVVEDSVVGTGTGYNQVNYLNSQAGHPYQGAGDPIIGFVHHQVLRMLPGGAMGQAGVIPATVSPGSSYSHTFNFTLPANYRANKVKLVAFVYKYYSNVLNGEVLNSGMGELGVAASVEAPVLVTDVEVKPNPVRDFGFVDATFTEITHATFELYNTFGQRVALLKEGNFTPGTHSVYFNTAELANGVYIMSVQTPDQTFTKKVLVAK